MYGNFHSCRDANYWKVRLVPQVMARISQNFSYRLTRFLKSDVHTAAARAFAWREIKVPFSYTLEASFFGQGRTEFVRSNYE